MSRLLALALPLVISLAVACAAPEEAPQVQTSDVVAGIPWPDRETARYRMVDDDGNDVGDATLSIERDGEQYVLRSSFDSGRTTDDSEVRVDAATLKPLRVTRTIVSEDETTEFTAVYRPDEDIVELTEKTDGDQRTNPLRLPDHYYDNETSLFLWRTIELRDGYEGAYNAVLSTRRRTVPVTLRVSGPERVETPAGAFDAWRVEVQGGGATLFAWYADTPERPLVRYENPELDLHYLLEAIE
ncbi:MAG TPA: DUF3108 domain-containing protein [Dehalococcoidia bacterium]|nr:DUF3108 domain-containing protein [Dehalococcoidia bacterium]